MWIEADILPQTQPIISVRQVSVIPMNNGHIPAHKPHLQTKNGWVVPVIGLDEPNHVTIRNPDKPCAKEVMMILVDSPVASKTFAQM
jgi:hypothetical protein